MPQALLTNRSSSVGPLRADEPHWLLEEPADRDPEFVQHVGDRQLIVGAEHAICALGAEEMGRAALVVQHDYERNPRLEILGDLGQQLRPSVAGRADLDDQFGRDFRVISGSSPRGYPIVAVI